jgi:HK97 family phage major capsid protein
MKKSDQLKALRAQKAEEAEKLLNGAAPSAEDKTKAQALIDEVKALGPQIENQLTIEAALLDKPAAPPAATLPRLDENGNTPGARVWSPASKLKAFTKDHSGRKAEENAFRAGKWLDATINGNPKSLKYCQEHGIFSYGTQIVNAVHEEGTNSTGGYLVPDEFERAVINLRDTYGISRQFCDVKAMSSDVHLQPKRLTGLTATARGESVAVTESNKTWGLVQMTAKSWDILSKFTRELNEDAVIGMADDLAEEMGLAFAYAEDNSLFNGDGSATYNGISGLYTIWFAQWAASESWKGGVTTATHDLPTEIDATDLGKVMGQVAPWAKQTGRCAWFCSPEYASAIFDRLTGAAGGNNAFDLAAGRPRKYAGYPVIECLTAPANDYTTAQDEKPMVWFGDMRSAVRFGNRRGMTVQILNELYAANGQIGIIGSERFDLNVHNYGTTSVKSPLVAFMGETS